MLKDNSQFTPSQVETDSKSILDTILHEGARRLLQMAIEAEVDSFIEQYKSQTDEHGHRLVVKNGFHKKCSILTSMGLVKLNSHVSMIRNFVNNIRMSRSAVTFYQSI